MRPHTSTQRTWLALFVGLTGVAAALFLPFAPVIAERTTITWPGPDEPATSTSALVVPYRPSELTATIPCSALRAATAQTAPVTVLATGSDSDGLVVTGSADRTTLRLGDVTRPLIVPTASADCRVTVESGPGGLAVLEADGRTSHLAGEPVPQVFGFRTDLDPAQAAGLSVSAVVTGPFATTPTLLKTVVVGVQLLCAVTALVLLRRGRGPPVRRRAPLRGNRLWWIDGAVIATFFGWAVIGPLAVDDGWATMIARNVAATGDPGNYHRWWNAAEVPFALSQQLLAPLTEISLSPLWLRLPSTLLGVATWFVLSRGVLGAALPVTARVRVLAAVCLLVTWLPFNLGTRPESYVALGVTAALALAWRARDPAGLAWLVLVAALTVPISPTAVLVAAPVLVFAPRLVAAARAGAPCRAELSATVALLCCVGAVGLTVIFADQTWDALVTATDWHRFFGPSLPWYEEPTRYRYLLQADQQGSFAKRLPVLFTIALLPIVGVLAARRRGPDMLGATAVRLAAVVVVSLLLLALGPSKWSYHFGSIAGVFAAFLTVAVMLVVRRARAADRVVAVVGVAGSVLLAVAAAVVFAGPNAWWLPAVYDVPWPTGPVRPLGVPLDNPLLWVGVLAAGTLTALAVLRRRPSAQWPALGPAVLTLVTLGTALAVLVGSFVAAQLRRPAGSLAMANLDRIAGGQVCGLADDIEVLPDGEVLRAAEPGGRVSGFAASTGFYPGAPPPDPPRSGTSEYLWGSRTPGAQATGEIVTGWFALPPLAPDTGVALSVSGRTSDGNSLVLEFGRADGPTVTVLGAAEPVDRPASDEDPAHPLWRSVGVDSAEVPAGADRVRIHAVDDRTGQAGWLAFTGPRLRTIVPLTDFLADRGPVLISWPQSFLFPCVRDIATVSGGVATTPRTVIESPRPWFTEDRDPDPGGTFAGLATFGQLNEVPSRLVGHPDVDWGSVLVSADPAVPDNADNYVRTTDRAVVWGAGATRGQRPEG
ncbi:MAG: arabinosyltransferase domain-containing protein [Mycobacterium sp.]